MSSRCSELLRAGLLGAAALGMLLASGCSREDRQFQASPPAVRSGVALGALQPGKWTAPRETAGPYGYNAYAISQGKHLFEWMNCSGCHAHGGGDIGPALMDEEWVYGNAPANVFATIVEGRPNGMPAFRERLGDNEVWQLVAYVISLGGQLPRDALPARNDHLFDKPGEQSLEQQPVASGALPAASQR